MKLNKRILGYAKRSNLTIEQVNNLYEIEKDLASRLRNSTREERLNHKLYTSLYDELFNRVPYHPQLKKKSHTENTAIRVAGSIQLLDRFMNQDSTFLEIGCGDCAVSIEAAKRVKNVYALDVSNEITKDIIFPQNAEFILSDGVSIPVPNNSINIAYSNQLMEHLHPDDVIEQLHNIYNSLTPGGCYICSTPNRLIGPSDVSEGFDDVSMGFHLKEYSATELYDIFKQSGFSKIYLHQGFKQYINFNTPLTPITVFIFKIYENMLSILPFPLRSILTKIIFRGGGMTVIGIK